MSFVWKRLLGTVPSLVGVIVLTFFISHALPGDPAAFFAGPAANAASIASIRTTLGLDRPLRAAAGVAGIVGVCPAVRGQHRASPRRVGRDARQWTRRSRLPRGGHRQRGLPDLLRRSASGVYFLL